MDPKVLIPTNEPNDFSLGPVDLGDSLHIPDADQLLIPLHAEKQTLDGWSLSFHVWPTLLDGWCNWYAQIHAEKSQIWEEAGIAECLPLSLAAPIADENFIAAISFFGSDALNAFIFRLGPLGPTLLDVAMLCALRLDGEQLSAYDSCSIDLNIRSGWSDYLEHYNRLEGPVTDEEHIAFLNMWLNRFLFCGASLGPSHTFSAIAK